MRYNKLLKEQLYWLNRHSEKIYSKSYKLYTKYLDKTIPQSMIDRCCNFKLLEKKCEEYNTSL
ncbi:MAG: type III toxin-antitoxin system ToxN/AbiQ family toxin [Bacilli bacterium]|nr:type III toxin-antitoxin system ToxN/AbiQ family toxin [Bacilli bacterium]